MQPNLLLQRQGYVIYLNLHVIIMLLILTFFDCSPKVQNVAFPSGYINLESPVLLGAFELEVFLVLALNLLQ